MVCVTSLGRKVLPLKYYLVQFHERSRLAGKHRLTSHLPRPNHSEDASEGRNEEINGLRYTYVIRSRRNRFVLSDTNKALISKLLRVKLHILHFFYLLFTTHALRVHVHALRVFLVRYDRYFRIRFHPVSKNGADKNLLQPVIR